MDRIRTYSKHPTRLVSRFTENEHGFRLAKCTYGVTATWLAGNFSAHATAWWEENHGQRLP